MELYTVKDVAEKLSLEIRTVRRKIRDKEIKAYKIGREWRIKEEDLMAFVERESNFD